MSLLNSVCCCGVCNATCMAVTQGTNDCTATIPPTAYQTSLPTYITVEIDLTWDGTPYSFSIVMKKYVTAGYTLCTYKMYCGNVSSCDAWPNTISGDVFMGKNGTCTQTNCSPCNAEYNPTNLPNPYLTLITCMVFNTNSAADTTCPCVYPDVGCSWVGELQIEMHAAQVCANTSDFYVPETASKNLANVEPDVCTPVYLINTTLPYQHCGAKEKSITDQYEVIDNDLMVYHRTCYSPLIGSYPLDRNDPTINNYNGTFDNYGASSIFYGALSSDTYTPCCGTSTSTGGHAIAWVLTRFEVV